MRTAVCVGLLALGRAAAVPALLFRNVIDKEELAPFKDDAEKIADALAEQTNRMTAARLESHKWSSESGLKKADEKDKWIIQLGDPKLQERKPYALRLQAMVQTQARHAQRAMQTNAKRQASFLRGGAKLVRREDKALTYTDIVKDKISHYVQRQYPRPPKQLDKDAWSGPLPHMSPATLPTVPRPDDPFRRRELIGV